MRRKSDGAYVLDSGKIYRQNLDNGGSKLIKRVQGAERQYRMNCPGCGLFVAYRSKKDSSKDAMLFVVEGAMSASISRVKKSYGDNRQICTVETFKRQLLQLLDLHSKEQPTELPGLYGSELPSLFRSNFRVVDFRPDTYGPYQELVDLLHECCGAVEFSQVRRGGGEKGGFMDLIIFPVSATKTGLECSDGGATASTASVDGDVDASGAAINTATSSATSSSKT